MIIDKEEFKIKYLEKFEAIYGKTLDEGGLKEKYTTLAALVRDFTYRNLMETRKAYRKKGVRQVYYFSIEFLPGRLLLSNLANLGLKEIVQDALEDLHLDLSELTEQEEDPGLGSGGLGRLAAGFLDSLASLGLPGHGYGLRYRYGLFEQKIINGEQMEYPDNWMEDGYPWELPRSDEVVTVRFGGNIRIIEKGDRLDFVHENYEPILGMPFDVPIVGYRNNTVNTLRLWTARWAGRKMDYFAFSRGDYVGATAHDALAQAITNVLYPNDNYYEGRKLRLKQQYFLVSAGLQSIIRDYKQHNKSLLDFYDRVAIHINDTHPALVVPELMRILMDEEGMEWDEAWRITYRTVSYTNHTVLPEALERWPVNLFQELLPRIYMIVEEINRRFCAQLLHIRPEKVGEMAIIADGNVHMGSLAIVGSYSVNGVARIHTEILKKRVMNSFCEYYPEKFINKTNGITHRRWLLVANPRLAQLITDTIGSSWINRPSDLNKLDPYAADAAFREKINHIKEQNKNRVASFIKDKYGLKVDPQSIFDVHIKRIHAYKRQLLNALHIMHMYNIIRENPQINIYPRTFIFAGKAAPAYYLAKRVIKLICTLGEVINNDRTIKDKIKVVFLENYNVSLAELVIPGSDVSEQLSTAGKEASGTGNMKLIMNGAVTIGTLDGANIEIREAVGEENFFLFGHTAEEIMHHYINGGYRAWDIYNQDSRVNTVCEQLINGFFPGDRDQFRGIYEYLLYHNDEYFVLKDFASYLEAQKMVEKRYLKPDKWQETCIKNIAHSGVFSSDRTINEYALDIWKIKPVIIPAKKEYELNAPKRVYSNASGRRARQSPEIIN